MPTIQATQIYPGAPVATATGRPVENVSPGSTGAPRGNGWGATVTGPVTQWLNISVPMLIALFGLAWLMIRFSPV